MPTLSRAPQMRAVIHRRYGGADALEHATVAVPVPRDREVLIRVEAAALNPADAYLLAGSPRVVRAGLGWRAPRQPVRGTDCAGTVVAVGAQVSGLRRGDRVMGEARGSLAEYAVADASRVAHLPPSVPAQHGAAVVMAGLAALQLLRKARVAAGQRVLINGASGGIGHLAVQLAVTQGAHVTAVCGPRSAGWVAQLGPERVIDHTRESVLEAGGGYDLILDNVGDHRLKDMCALATPRGTVIPNSGAPGPDGGALRRVALAQWRNATGRRRIVSLYSAPTRADLEALVAMLAQGSLAVRVDAVHPLDQAPAAMARVIERHVAGKIVVTP